MLQDMHAHSERASTDPRAGGPRDQEAAGAILIVDDDPHFLRVLQRTLAGEKFAVTATPSPADAVALIGARTFDLVICDLRMPGCDGLSLLQHLRSSGNPIPVIILTAYGDVDSYLEAMNAGATEYLNKPVKSEELIQVVRNCLRRSNSRHRPKSRNDAA